MNNGTAEQLNILVSRTVFSGVRPIELVVQPIYDCDYGEIKAYRIYAKINSITFGVLSSEDYVDYSSNDKLLIELGHNLISKAVSFLMALSAQERIRFVSLVCPTSIIYDKDLYSFLKKLVVANDENARKLCLEFSSSVSDLDSETLKNALIDIKAAGVKTAIDGYGGVNFSIEKLLAACPDYLFCDKSLAGLSTDYEKSGAIAPMINLAKSLGANVIAQGIESDVELREFRSRDAFGFIPDSSYKGSLEVSAKTFMTYELLARGEEDD